GRADEVVVRDVQLRKNVPEFLRHLVGKLRRRQARLPGGTLDFLAVLVGARQKKDVVAHEPMCPRDSVGHHRGVRVAKVRLGVDVVDRRGDEKGAHDGRGVSPYACKAIAWTSFTDKPWDAASADRSSNSGTALTIFPSRHASLNRTSPSCVFTWMISRRRHSRSTSL